MKMGVTVKVERKKNLAAMSARVHQALKAGVQEDAEEIRDVAKSLVAVDTGNLRGTIEAHSEGELEWEVTEGGPTPESPNGADYALPQEHGTRTQPGTPHFTPATEQVRAKFEGRMSERVRKAIG